MKNGMLIINYNDFNSTIELIENVKEYRILDKIVIIDNHSTDGSLSDLRKLRIPKLIILEMEKNLGYSAAINFGSRYLIEKLGKCNIIISNPDIILNKEEDIQELLLCLSKSKVGIVGPTILEQGALNRGWKNPSAYMDAWMNLPYIHRWIRNHFIKYPECHYQGKVSQVEVLSGCFFCISSSTLEKINFLDEHIFLYYEENILSKKIKNNNLHCIVHNEVLIIHNHSVTIDRNMKKIKKYRAQKKSQYYFHVTYQNANLLEKFFLKSTKLLSEYILSIYYLLKDFSK